MEKQLLKVLFIFASSVAMLSCSNVDEVGSGLDTYSVVSGTFTQQDSIALDGTGTVRFAGTLGSVNSNKAIEVAGSLLDSGSIAVVFNSDDLNMPTSRGVIVKIARDGSGVTVSGTISVNGNSVNLQALRLAYVLPASFDLIIQVYNSVAGSRVLIWRKDVTTYALANVEIDSAESSHLSGTYPVGGGTGLFVGLQLTKARITAALVIDPKVTLP